MGARTATMQRFVCILFFFFLFLPGCSSLRGSDGVLFQVSTINALLEGVYDGTLSFGELKKHGDTGTGTFDALDGEMIGLDGVFYQIKADGAVYPVSDSMKTPFAAVTFFTPNRSAVIIAPIDAASLEAYLDSQLPTVNIPYAIKIEGTFSYVRTRSVPAQKKPYPPLLEVVKNQPVFEFRNVKGTIVGFRFPEYMKGLNVAGYHLHFITEDRRAGGHLLECRIHDASVEIASLPKLSLELPEQKDFYRVYLSGERQKEVERVEK